MKKMNQSGDTLIEVLMATVVISIVLASAYTLTNRATRQNQAAFERTDATNRMSSQIELIRGARTAGANSPVWQAILAKANSTYPDYTVCAPNSTTSFYIDPDFSPDYNDGAMVVDVSATTPYPHPLFDVWVEPYRLLATDNYIDFHVRACWEGIGGDAEQSSGLVMRISI